MSTFRSEFLGCKVNQYDAERARRRLLERGWTEVDEDASLLLLAGCTVTSTAARRGRQLVRSSLRRRPETRVAVLGCVSEDDRRYYESLAPAVTMIPSARDDAFLEGAFQALLELGPAAAPTAVGGGRYRSRRTRAYLKVEDGCDLHCSYCIIPSVRGRARSRSPEEVEAELRRRLEEGVPEVVLTGIHLGHYGRRTPWSLAALVRRLLEVPGRWRLRLSSLEVTEIDEELTGLLRQHPRLAPHLHLPLQSGSARILRGMRRPYTIDRFRRTIERLRRAVPDLTLTTDVIVGFPGESDEDFEATLEVCREARFAKIHSFPYSARQGTAAEALPERVHGDAVRERKAALFELEGRLRRRSLEARLGREAQVVVERVDSHAARGTDERYHRTVLIGDRTVRRGDLVVGRVTEVREKSLLVIAPGVRA